MGWTRVFTRINTSGKKKKKKKKSDRGLACGISIVRLLSDQGGTAVGMVVSAGVNQQGGGTFALDTGASAAKALQRRSGRLTVSTAQ